MSSSYVDLRTVYKIYDENRFICGMAGYGKSTLLKITMRALPKSARVILWDPNGQHGDLIHSAGFKAYKGGEIIGRNIYVPKDGSPEEFDIIVNQAMKQGNTIVVVEEAQEVMNSSATRSVLKMLRTGRNRGVTYIAVTQIPAQCRDSVLSNAHYVECFRLRRPDDTGYVAGWLGIPRDSVSELPKFQYIAISQDGEPSVHAIRPVGSLNQIQSRNSANLIASIEKKGIKKI
jgi:hypothetical protein